MKRRITRRIAMVAGQLRRVQRARNEFVARWVVESLIVGPLLLDQVLAALGGGANDSGVSPGSPSDRAEPSDGR